MIRIQPRLIAMLQYSNQQQQQQQQQTSKLVCIANVTD
jgi:hypothetical protein